MSWGRTGALCAGDALVGWLELKQVWIWVSWGMPCWGHFDGMAETGVGVRLGSQGTLRQVALAGWLDLEEVWAPGVLVHDLPVPP